MGLYKFIFCKTYSIKTIQQQTHAYKQENVHQLYLRRVGVKMTDENVAQKTKDEKYSLSCTMQSKLFEYNKEFKR